MGDKILPETASQTAGPYVHIGLMPSATGIDVYKKELGQDIAGPNAKGERIRVEGFVFDGSGDLVKDILIEIWQANREGHYAHRDGGGPVEEGFRGWGRAMSDFATGEWGFDTIKPGRVVGSEGREQAPHLNLWLVARGINVGLNTRLYFDDEEEANAADPVLNQINSPASKATLIAKRFESDGKPTYRFDIRLQGDNETVFFDI